MFKVIYKLQDLELMIFQSADINECWQTVKNHLYHPTKAVRNRAKTYIVVNKAGELQERPEDVRSLLNYLRIVA